jgi:ribA/ribD-fused uncharacterized protein
MTVVSEFKHGGPYGFLSNFYPCSGLYGPTIEHQYQAMKFQGTGHTDLIEQVLNAPDAKAAKQLASQNKQLVRPDWQQVNLGIMWTLLCVKFNRKYNPDLRAMLVATGGAYLIEGNYWHDNFFGSCSCAKCGSFGANHLGLMLMERRDQLRGIINE